MNTIMNAQQLIDHVKVHFNASHISNYNMMMAVCDYKAKVMIDNASADRLTAQDLIADTLLKGVVRGDSTQNITNQLIALHQYGLPISPLVKHVINFFERKPFLLVLNT